MSANEPLGYFEISRRGIVGMGILASIFGSASGAAQKVRSVGEDDFVDLDLPLASHAKDPTGKRLLVARGVFEDTPVGFSVEIDSAWRAQPLEDGSATFYWGRVTIRSIGPPSDHFVSVLARLYGLPSPATGMLPAIEAEAVGLANDPGDMDTSAIRMKLFFHSDSEDRYAEVFLNTDIPNRLVQFHEKDMEYRKELLRALHAVA